MTDKSERTCEEILADLKTKSPQEQANFSKGVFRALEEIPMRMILKDVNRPMAAEDWLAMRAWVAGVPGAAKPDFVVDATPVGGAEGLENVRVALRNLLDATPPL